MSLDVTWCRWSCRHRCIPYKHSAYHLHSDSHRPVCSCKCRSSLRAGSLPGTICVTLCNCVIPCGCPFESVIKIFKLFFSLIYFYIFLAWKAYRTSHTMPLFVCLPICLLTSDRFHPGCRFFSEVHWVRTTRNLPDKGPSILTHPRSTFPPPLSLPLAVATSSEKKIQVRNESI